MSTATAASAAIGAWKMKIARQEKTSVSAPPSAGPTRRPAPPRPPQPPPGAAAAEDREHRDQSARPAQGLARAGDEQRREVARQRARQRRDGQQREPARADRADRSACGALERQQGDREHQGVDADDRGDALDRRVEVAEDLRQAEGDDRAVGQRDTGGEGENRRRADVAQCAGRRG